jgi:hypothetical protein
MTIDLQSMNGVNEYATLKLLKRVDSSNPWLEVGTNTYPGTGTIVVWNTISDGFSEFAIGGAGDNSLPVTLSAFEASLEQEAVVLRWKTESEIENLGYIMNRREKGDKEWKEIATYQTNTLLVGQGNTSESTNYYFKDTSVREGLTYEYQLADVSYAGEIIYHNIIEIEVENLYVPKTYKLGKAYPNPFNPSTVISWQLPVTSYVKISIFNILGENVATIVSEKMSEGHYQQEWIADNFPSGVYYYVLQAGNFRDSKKMILIK